MLKQKVSVCALGSVSFRIITHRHVKHPLWQNKKKQRSQKQNRTTQLCFFECKTCQPSYPMYVFTRSEQSNLFSTLGYEGLHVPHFEKTKLGRPIPFLASPGDAATLLCCNFCQRVALCAIRCLTFFCVQSILNHPQ